MTLRQMAVLSLNLILAAAADLPAARGQEVLPSEYQMKAAYLFNFTKFVSWPAQALPPDDSPLVIGILGDDPFEGVLDSTVQGKVINGHPLAVRHIKALAELKSCHVLFISSSEQNRWPEIQSALDGANVLTVSEHWDHFLQDGGMICFFMNENRVCFDINDAAAKHAGLKISSKLLQLKKAPTE